MESVGVDDAHIKYERLEVNVHLQNLQYPGGRFPALFGITDDGDSTTTPSQWMTSELREVLYVAFLREAVVEDAEDGDLHLINSAVFLCSQKWKWLHVRGSTNGDATDGLLADKRFKLITQFRANAC